MMDNLVERVRALLGDTNEEQDTINEAAREIERLRRIIYNLLDDGDEADRAEARAALGEDK
jgi:cell division protein FtsB